MSNPDYAIIITSLFPDSLWGLVNNDLATLTWDESNVDEAPSREMLDTAWPTVEYEVAYAAVEHARQQDYRETSDPIFFEYQRGDKTEAEWLDAVQAVKTANPYPTPPKK